MKPEDLVPTRSTCIALKEAGFPQDTFLAWDTWKRLNEGGWLVRARNGFETFDEYLAAPTLGEILEQLPEEKLFPDQPPLKSMRSGYLTIGKDRALYETCEAYPLLEMVDSNPAEAAARLWIKVNA